MRPDFYKKIKGGAEVLDFNKFIATKKRIFIILSERFQQGKTFNAKEFILEHGIKHGKKSIGLYNTGVQHQESASGFIRNNKLAYPHAGKDIIYTHKGLYDQKTKQIFCIFKAVSQGDNITTERNEDIKFIFYDEFNRGLRMIKTSQVSLIDVIAFTFLDLEALFILGNQKTFANPLLAKLGITHFVDEVFEVPLSKLVYIPRTTDPVRFSQVENSIAYELAQDFNTLKKNVSNINTTDDMAFIIPEALQWSFKTKFSCILAIKQEYYEEGISEQGRYFYTQVEKPDERKDIYALTGRDIKVGYKIANIDELKRATLEHRMFFDNAYTQAIIMDAMFKAWMV